MLKCDRIHLSEVIDVNKADGSHECIVCLYWFFWRKILNFNLKCVMVVMI